VSSSRHRLRRHECPVEGASGHLGGRVSRNPLSPRRRRTPRRTAWIGLLGVTGSLPGDVQQAVSAPEQAGGESGESGRSSRIMPLGSAEHPSDCS
jgi:hypothetical protein